MKHRTPVLIYLTLICISLVVIWNLYPQLHPFGGLYTPLSKSEIETKAFRLATEQQLPLAGYYADAVLKRNTQLLRQTQSELGLDSANTALRQGLNTFYWEVRWYKEEMLPMQIFSQASDKTAENIMKSALFNYDVQGNLIDFKLTWPDTSILTGISRGDAENLVAEFIDSLSPYRYPHAPTVGDDSTARDQPDSVVITEKYLPKDRIDYEISWSTTAPLLKTPLSIRVTVAGNRIVELSSEYQLSGQYQTSFVDNLDNYLFPLLLFLIVITTVVIALKRWQAYEMDFRFGVGLGIVSGILFGIYFYLVTYRTADFNIFIAMVINSLFTGGSLVFVWAVGESLGRETWKEKFIPLDLLRKGYVLHSQIGLSLVAGIGIGFFSLATWLVAVKYIGWFQPMAIIPVYNGAFFIFSSEFPLLRLLAVSGFVLLWNVTTYTLFGMTMIRRIFRSPWVVIGLTTLVVTIVHREGLEPYGTGVLVEMGIAAMALWAFWRYDIIAAFTAALTTAFFYQATGLFFTGNGHFLTSGIILAAIFLVILGYGIVTLFTEDRIKDFDRLAPIFYKNISERQRLQKELEIAREVQMSFLPESMPRVQQLDIASRCVPALEIGGDYYDFVELSPKRLGVVIGDVSGKGTQAAFYMTLTKGFLRALANMSDSPAFVLSQLNRLFYQNVRRGVFISMIYGIFDLETNELILARAGHNPVVMRQTQNQLLQSINPGGLALGMERGDRFERIIQEVRIPFQPDDLFVFYTDGFTEAMNKQRQEFGDHRFEEAIRKYATGTAGKIMEGIFQDVQQFVGKTPQNDDMTIVVIKIREANGQLSLRKIGEQLRQANGAEGGNSDGPTPAKG